jgi:hypothetical protein
MGGGFRGQMEPHRLKARGVDPGEQRERKLGLARTAVREGDLP